MAAEAKTFKVLCCHCGKTFQVRFPLAGSDPDKPDDAGQVSVDCLYCQKPVMIKIPRKYIAEETLLRGVREP